MKKAAAISLSLMVLILSVLIMSPKVSANESAVEIKVRDKAAKGENIDIILDVSHEGNNLIHHTEWVDLRINGKSVKRWEYSMFNKPPGDKFSVSYSYTLDGDIEIEAEAYCNLHGSRNIDKRTVSVTESQSGSQ